MRWARWAAMGAVFFGLLVGFGPGRGAPRVLAAEDDQRSTVSVVGSGRVSLAPDIATVSLGVEATGATLEATQADAATRMQAVVDSLAARGVARDDIRTSRLSISPVYDQRETTRVRGYQVSNAVDAKIRDLNAVGSIIDAATSAGANRVNGIGFAVEDDTAAKNRARELAMANARAKADQLAALAGTRVVGVKAIAESDFSPPVPVRFAAPATLAAPAAPTPVEPGLQEVRTQVSVTYLIQ